VSAAFSRRRVAALEPRVDALAPALAEGLAPATRPPSDLFDRTIRGLLTH
jgi:cytochrome P450